MALNVTYGIWIQIIYFNNLVMPLYLYLIIIRKFIRLKPIKNITKTESQKAKL